MGDQGLAGRDRSAGGVCALGDVVSPGVAAESVRCLGLVWSWGSKVRDPGERQVGHDPKYMTLFSFQGRQEP